jgi:phage terminase large subunit-like protein
MKRTDYRGHPRKLIDEWFVADEDLSTYDPKIYYFDAAAARRPIDFRIKCCTHVEGSQWAGKPLIPEQWQFQTWRDFFGWKRVSDGFRRYRTLWLRVARGNGKSTDLAAGALYFLTADGEAWPRVFSAATEKDQAGIVFQIAKQMVLANKELSARLQIFKKSMYQASPPASYVVLSGAPKKSGLNPHAIIFDEVHEQPNRDLWDILETAKVKRSQPATWAATTAGYDRETICYELDDYATRVRDEKIQDPRWLVKIFAADDKKDDWTTREAAAKANPNLDISVKWEDLRADVEKAKKVPAYRNTYKRLHLNIWTQQNEVWMPMDEWRACGAPFPLEELDGQICFDGLDLGATQDLAARARVWPVLDPRKGIFHFYAHVHFWLPKENIRHKIDEDNQPYDLWAEQGYITLTEGNLIDYDKIRTSQVRDGERYNIQEIAIDRWNATQITTQLEGEGFTMVPFGQGFASMGGPTKQLMETVLLRTLHHANNPVLNWMAGNVSVRTDPAGFWKPDKKASRKRIDGIVALIMALGRATLHLDSGESVYGSRGVLTL